MNDKIQSDEETLQQYLNEYKHELETEHPQFKDYKIMIHKITPDIIPKITINENGEVYRSSSEIIKSMIPLIKQRNEYSKWHKAWKHRGRIKEIKSSIGYLQKELDRTYAEELK